MNSKKILITVVAVIAVIAATFGITYAAWDKSSDSSSLNATVGNNVFIEVKDVKAGDANKNLVPKETPNLNSVMTDCLTLGSVKVTNNPINNVSSDINSLDVVWDIEAVQVTFVGASDKVTMDVAEFKSIFKISITYADSKLSNYNEIVPMDTELNVIMEFIDNAENIASETANKYREAKFVVTVQFNAVKKAN